MQLKIKQGNIKTVVLLSKEIDEFQNPHDEKEYEKRLTEVPHVILVAYVEEKPVGFKVGYERAGSFYSWMGAVHAAWRRKGIAKALADEQEIWAKQHGYTSITFKTRNRLKPMLMFGIRNGFNVVGFEEKADVNENRILLRKDL